MASKKYKEMQDSGEKPHSVQPKHKQLIKMLTFRVVPAYYKEIEKVANHQDITVSKLIRTYIKDGMKKDGELTDREEKSFGL
jgi:predicted DNA-binding ribbon-helix-helix protein